MIKISRYLYIHIFTVILFAVCLFTHNFFELLAVYGVMFLHELAHLAAAAAIGLRVSHIVLYPFGVNLRLKNKMVRSISDEIILYAAGPLCNAVFALAAIVLYRHFPIYAVQYFYIANTALLAVNLLPAVPLDGGIILKKILTHNFGAKTAGIVMNIISVCISLILILLGSYIVYLTKFNFSVLLLSVLLIGNIFTQKEKYNLDYVKELMFYKNKSRKNVAVKMADIDDSPHEISKKFSYGKYNVIFQTDKNGKIRKIATETEIIDKILGNF